MFPPRPTSPGPTRSRPTSGTCGSSLSPTPTTATTPSSPGPCTPIRAGATRTPGTPTCWPPSVASGPASTVRRAWAGADDRRKSRAPVNGTGVNGTGDTDAMAIDRVALQPVRSCHRLDRRALRAQRADRPATSSTKRPRRRTSRAVPTGTRSSCGGPWAADRRDEPGPRTASGPGVRPIRHSVGGSCGNPGCPVRVVEPCRRSQHLPCPHRGPCEKPPQPFLLTPEHGCRHGWPGVVYRTSRYFKSRA